jgi:diaminopimelate epimerase
MGQLTFYKYQGTGNDFIMVDNRNGIFDKNDLSLVRKLCSRKFGIGADGLILIQNCDGLDFEMIYYNADGSQSLCGNGSRCAVNFAKALGIIGNKTNFMAIDGLHEAIVQEDTGIVSLKMGNVSSVELGSDYYFINTGSPHWVKYVHGIEGFDVVMNGRAIRYNDRFEEKGTNVNFVEKLSDGSLFVRTYERGVEDETLSCGTGVTACALAASMDGMKSPVQINTLGGKLEVSYKGKADTGFTDIWLIGPAVMVFEGKVSF